MSQTISRESRVERNKGRPARMGRQQELDELDTASNGQTDADISTRIADPSKAGGQRRTVAFDRHRELAVRRGDVAHTSAGASRSRLA